MSTDKYNAKFAINQSSIKEWRDIPPQEWYKRWILGIRPRRDTSSLSFGSLLDTFCFEPGMFDKRFVISEVKKPSDKIVAIVTDIFNHLAGLNRNIKELNDAPAEKGIKKVKIPLKPITLEDRDIIDKFTKEHDYYASKPDQAYNKIMKEGTEYFEFLKKVGNKLVVTKEEKERAEEQKEVLYTNKKTAGFFVPKKDCEVLFQQQLFTNFELEGFDNIEMLPLKGMPDIIHINHTRKEIREVDLKWTNSAFGFNSPIGPVKKFGYVDQHSFYNFLLQVWRDENYPGYTIQAPLNVVIDDLKIPYLYMYNMDDLIIKQKGIENTPIRGWEDTLNDIAYHLDKNDWTYPIEHLKNGFILINVFNKK